MDPAAARRRLIGKDVSYGCFIGLPSVAAADIIGRCGYDFGLIDMEHGPIGFETALGQLAALERSGVAGVIRTPIAANPWISQALDLGAAGVMAPNVRSPEMAEEVVAAATIGPEGRRGVATRVIRAADYGEDPDYEEAWNSLRVVIAQIESPRGLDAAAEIASVDGVDVLFFGPADYAAQAGYPGSADVAAALDRLIAVGRAAGKRVGSVPLPGVTAADMIARGVSFAAVASDVALLRVAGENALAAAGG